MRKHTLILMSILLIFLICVAMTCDDGEMTPTTYVPCKLIDVQLNHWDNTGEHPEIVTTDRIKKEAYLLEIALESDAVENNSLDAPVPRLEDGIVKVNIFTVSPFNENLLEGSNISSCFQSYPIIMPNIMYDSTLRGDTIQYFETATKSIYKALMVVPQAGTHQFRVVLTTALGKIIEKISEPIILY